MHLISHRVLLTIVLPLPEKKNHMHLQSGPNAEDRLRESELKTSESEDIRFTEILYHTVDLGNLTIF